MAPSMAVVLSRGPVCRSCLLASAQTRTTRTATTATTSAPALRRNISQGFLRKTAEAQEAWNRRANEIWEGKQRNLWDILEERGYVKDTAGTRDTIREIMRRKRIGAYVGVDPTASSLHVGHLLPMMPLFWMYMHGYGAHTLLGGSTAKIGDPTDRLKDRDNIAKADLALNVTKMHFQMKKLWLNVEEQARRFGYKKEWAWRRALVNNNTWWNSTPMLDVLRRVGKSIRIGPLLSRDTVKRKMEGDGVSFAEFSYPIMQGWDWWMLFSKQKVQMQIGGSDQFGNIVTGIDIVKAARDNEPDPSLRIPRKSDLDDPVGFTVPLLTDSSGAKFGKSAGNAIWLDPFMTPTFDLYGYFVRRPDEDVEKLLKLFTFLPMEEITNIMAQQAQDPAKRVAHHRLAYEVVTLVHGEKEAQEAEKHHRLMYNKGGVTIPMFTKKPGEEYQEPTGPTTHLNAPRPDMILPESLITGKSIGRILFAAGLAESATAGHRLASQQGAYVAGLPGRPVGKGEPMDPSQVTWNPVKLWFPQETQRYLIDGKLLILRKGKHNVRIIEMVSDEEYEKSGQTYPGQPFTGRVRRLRERMAALKSGKTTPEEVVQMMREEAEQDEADEKDDILKFPDEKNPEVTKLEQQLEELLKEARAGEGKAKTEETSKSEETPKTKSS